MDMEIYRKGAPAFHITNKAFKMSSMTLAMMLDTLLYL